MRNFRLLFTLLIFMIMVGCLPNDKAPTMPTSTMDVPSTKSIPVQTATFQVSIAQPSATPTRTSEPTITSLPTLSTSEAYRTLRTLILEQNQCVLPCWLGIVPGQSNFEDIYNTFLQFSEVGHVALSSPTNWVTRSDWISLDVKFPTYTIVTQANRASESKVGIITVNAHISKIKNEHLVYGDPAYVEMWHEYFLPRIFAEFGKPGKIFLDTTLIQAESTTNYPFVIWIIYPEQGFLVRYEGINEKVGNNLRICPSQSDLKMIMWSAKTSNYDRYESFIKGDKALAMSLGPQPIESVTEFSVESFYSKFKNADTDTCFYTPVSIWPPN